MDHYQELAAALAVEGIRCQFQMPGQLVVSRQVGPFWPDRGNSFWVTRVGGQWHLFTWSPVGYRVPAAVRIESLCRKCMAHEASAMAKVPPDIIQEFGLAKLCDEEAAAVYAQMV